MSRSALFGNSDLRMKKPIQHLDGADARHHSEVNAFILEVVVQRESGAQLIQAFGVMGATCGRPSGTCFGWSGFLTA